MRFDSLFAALLLVPLIQDPTPAPQEPEKKPFALGDAAIAAHLNEQVEGMWKLTNAVGEDLALTQGDTVGYALFHDGYLGVEIHGRSSITFDKTNGDFFQSGLQRYFFGVTGRMYTFLLIGTTNLTADESVSFMAPGDRREYQVTILNDILTMDRTDGVQLTFMRMGKTPFPGTAENVDAFGRPLGPPTKPAPDKTPPKKP